MWSIAVLEMVDGSHAVVVNQTNDVKKPRVQLLTGPGGEALSSGQPDMIHVGMPFEGQTPIIAGVSSHDRYLPVPDFDESDPEEVGPCAHDACLAHDKHDHQH